MESITNDWLNITILTAFSLDEKAMTQQFIQQEDNKIQDAIIERKVSQKRTIKQVNKNSTINLP